MNSKSWVVLGVTILCFMGKTMATDVPQRVVGSISGKCLRAIQAAIPEIHNRKLELALYDITIFENATSLVILFSSPKRQHGERGNLSGQQPNLEVEILKDTNVVVRSNYIR